MFSSLAGAPREGPLRRWAVSLPALCTRSAAPPETALGDRSHAISTMNSVVERRKTGKMRLLAGFGLSRRFETARTGAFVWRNRQDRPYTELGIDAIYTS